MGGKDATPAVIFFLRLPVATATLASARSPAAPRGPADEELPHRLTFLPESAFVTGDGGENGLIFMTSFLACRDHSAGAPFANRWRAIQGATKRLIRRSLTAGCAGPPV